jgi:AcrR family transcriptional regulator
MTEPVSADVPSVARKRGRPTARERTARRDEILDAAVRLFSARGFEGVTLDDVAVEAHVTKRTIYAYYGDRTALFLAAVERLRDRALWEPSRADDVTELAGTIVFALHSDEAIGLHRLVISEARRFPELARRFYQDGPQAYIAAISQRLPDDDDPARAEQVFGLLLGEPHRRRLLGLAPAPNRADATAYARSVLREFGLASEGAD